ncbi:MAG: serine hydrolase domain-containing protein [Erysipelotrichaceae bacterium]|jgi:CubicO group peptidase (beta-lactamase class C family)
MKKSRLIIICSLVLMLILNLIVPVRILAVTNENVSLENIGQRIEAYVAENIDTTAGMSVAVFSDKETLYRNSFGYSDIEKKIPVTEDTVMEWGSVSKLLVWVSVMQLVEQGVIDLNTDISKYLPEGFLKNINFAEAITMLNLMNHNAGFEETIIGMATAKEERIISLKEYLQKFQPEQVYKPGLVCAYSNWGTTLAAYIVEYVAGMSYDEYVNRYIFKPLEMNDSAIRADLTDNQTVRERRMELKIYQGLKEIKPNMNYTIMYPAGSCTSTIADMQKFAQSLLSEETVLFENPETYYLLFSPSLYIPKTDIPRNYHGFWYLDTYDAHIIGHGGNTAGCTSQLLLDIENGIGMVVQTNQAGENTYNYLMPELVFGTYQGPKSDYVGLARSARTISHGPLKIYSLLSVVGIELEDFNVYSINRNDELKMDVISAPYGDFLMIGFRDIALDVIVLVLYLLSILYCLFNVFRHLIIAVFRKIRKQKRPDRLPLFYPAGILLVLFPVISIFFIFSSLLTLNQWHLWTYRMAFLLMGLTVPLLLFLIVYGWKQYKDNKTTYLKRWDLLGIFICMLITVINIIYWQLGCFWMI